MVGDHMEETDCYYDANQNLMKKGNIGIMILHGSTMPKTSMIMMDNSNLIQKIRQVWDGELFVNEIKNIYAYDANNKKIWSMMYYWQDDDWSESQEFDYQYDADGYLYKIESQKYVDD